MTDLSSLSDAELEAIANGGGGGSKLRAADYMDALIGQETGGRIGVRGPQTPYGRAEGLTQMLPTTARATAERTGLGWQPEMMTATTPEAGQYQRDLGQAYLQEGLDATGNLEDGLRYYHGGPDRRLWGPKTEAYVKGVKAKLGLRGMSDAELEAIANGGDTQAAPAPAAAPARAPVPRAPVLADRGTGTVPRISDMRMLVNPGYAAARQGLVTQQKTLRDNNAKFVGGKAINGLQGFNDQAVNSLGVGDELSGGISALVQGGSNVIDRFRGVPMKSSMGDAGQAAMDLSREQSAQYAKDHPALNVAATIGGLAVSGVPRAGAAILSPLRAGASAAAVQAPYALARHNGTLQERLPKAAADTAVAFGMGSTLQGVSNALGARAASRRAAVAANPELISDARRLSMAGTELTPGQAFGGPLKTAEDVLTSAPMTGYGINAARTRGIDSYNVAELNQALEPIGVRLGTKTNLGRTGIREANRAITAAYTDALDGVTVAPDAQFAADTAKALATRNLTRDARVELQSVIDDITSRFNGPVSGQDFKMLDADIGKAIRAAQASAATTPSARPFIGALSDFKAGFNAALERANPTAATAKAAADEAFARFVRVRDAAQSLGTAGRAGRFLPGDINRAVRAADNSSGNIQYGMGTALGQELSDAAATTLPSKVADSGTAGRALALTGYGGLLLSPATHPFAVPVVAADALGAALYSRPVMGAFNAGYRAFAPGAATGAASRLAGGVARNPGAIPLEVSALQQLEAQLQRAYDLRNAPKNRQPGRTR